MCSQFLELFFSDIIFKQFIEQTNSYAKDSNAKSRWHRWTELDEAELKRFFACVLYLGLVKYTSRREAWDNPIMGSKWLPTVMSKTRFEAILACLHWTNAFKMPQEERKLKNKADCFWTIKTFLDIINSKLLFHYSPKQKLSGDEACIPTKTNHPAKCYNPSKPNSWHFKVYCLNEADGSYLLKFFIYQGNDPVFAEKYYHLSKSEYPVIRLLDEDCLKYLGYLIALDNWYSSVRLCVDLRKWDMYMVGTIRVNRSNLPEFIIIRKVNKTTMPRGFIRMASTTIEGHKLYFVAFVDTRQVHMITSLPFTPREVEVMRHVVDTKKKVYLGIQAVKQPDIAQIYNKAMGGTDSMDRSWSDYRTMVRAHAWQKRIFFWVLDVMVINARILYVQTTGIKITHAKFKEQLCKEWGLPVPRIQKRESSGIFRGVSSASESLAIHTPIEFKFAYSKIKGVQGKGKQVDTRRRCVECSSHVRTMCKECDIYVCIGEKGSKKESCWSKFHRGVTEK